MQGVDGRIKSAGGVVRARYHCECTLVLGLGKLVIDKICTLTGKIGL